MAVCKNLYKMIPISGTKKDANDQKYPNEKTFQNGFSEKIDVLLEKNCDMVSRSSVRCSDLAYNLTKKGLVLF